MAQPSTISPETTPMVSDYNPGNRTPEEIEAIYSGYGQSKSPRTMDEWRSRSRFRAQG